MRGSERKGGGLAHMLSFHSLRQAPMDLPASAAPSTDTAPIDWLEAFRRLRAASGALLDQALLHGELARVEWAEEKRRLSAMLIALLVGFAFLQCGLLAAGAVVLASSWDTAYRTPALIGVIGLYALGVGLAWRRFQALSARSSEAFAATRAELTADLELLRSKL